MNRLRLLPRVRKQRFGLPREKRIVTVMTGEAVEANCNAKQMAQVLALTERPGYLIRRLYQISVATFLSRSKAFQVTPVQYGAVHVIRTLPGIDQSRLGKILALDRQTASNVVGRLCEKGLVMRQAKDGRTMELRATDRADALVAAMKEPLSSIDATMLEPLTLEEQEEFLRLLRKLVTTNNNLSRVPQQQ